MTKKQEDDETKEPPTDEDEDVEKSLLKALIEEIKGLRADLSKEENGEDDEDEDAEKAKKSKASKEENGDDDEEDNEEKSKKSAKSEELTVEKAVEFLKAKGVNVSDIESGITPRPEGGGQPVAKSGNDRLQKSVQNAFPFMFLKEGK
jgi:hypothetical protein